METSIKYNPGASRKLLIDDKDQYGENMALAQNQPKYVFSDLMAQTRKSSKQPIEDFIRKG